MTDFVEYLSKSQKSPRHYARQAQVEEVKETTQTSQRTLDISNAAPDGTPDTTCEEAEI